MPIKAAVMTGPGQPLEIRSLPDPDLEPGSILLETIASEVCGTDVHLLHGRLAGVPYPIVPGHVSVGRVLERRGVDRDALGQPLGDGDVVTFLDVHETCHRCFYCRVAHQSNRCASRKVYGITYTVDEGPLGGWAERIHLKPGVLAVKLPEALSADDVIGGGCGLFTGFAAVERSGLAMGDTVVVQGIGPVGLSAVAFAHLRGAGRILAIGDPEDRRSLALGFGADTVLSVTGMDPEARLAAVRDATSGRGADVVIEASGARAAVPEGLALLRDGGCYTIAGHYTDAGAVEINAHTDINRKHARIVGQWGTDFSHIARSLPLVARHRIPFARIVGGRYPIERAGEALADVEALRVTKALIVP
ncbi:MAG: zinc-binding dehydrogenase [Gemmatimonadetes bacterium]|nr:zinc-binding dehydrogenase [Gemmatimonadota bacterium]